MGHKKKEPLTPKPGAVCFNRHSVVPDSGTPDHIGLIGAISVSAEAEPAAWAFPPALS